MSHSAILDTTLHKTVLKFMLKIISVKHYKNKDILTELDDTQLNNAQNGNTRSLSKS